MTTSTGYSLWLQPTGDAFDHLAGIIAQLSAQYRTPVFEPHVTLLGGLTGNKDALAARTAQLAKLLKPNVIQLTTLDYLDEYFRCLFANAEKTPWLIDANTKARKLFHREDAPEFMPHLSLLYGDILPATKQAAIVQLGLVLDLEFPVASVHLVSTNGEPKEWYKIGEFKFG
jgi:2'-5' RNA ligase